MIGQEVALRAASRYKRIYWWAELDDLKQVALMAVFRARKSWDVKEGIPFGGYAWRAATIQLRNFVRKMSAPVSAKENDLDNLVGIFRASVGQLENKSNTNEGDAVELLDSARTREQVREVFGRVEDGYLARMVLLDEDAPRVVAAREGIPVRRVYEATRRVRNAIWNSRELWETWKSK